jgi:hypothetical protein
MDTLKKTRHLALVLLGLAGCMFTKSSEAQTYTPKSYYTFENSTTPLKDSTGFFNLDAAYFQSAYTIPTTNLRGVGKYLQLDSAGHYIRAGSVMPDTAVTFEFLFKFGYNFNETTDIIRRFDGAFQIQIGYPFLTFNTNIKNGSTVISDQLKITFDGIGRKSYGYYIDGEWHHLVFKYSAQTGLKEIWVDGECPTGFSKTTATGAFDNAASNNKETVLNSSSVYNKIIGGGLDEFAIYHIGLPANMIYKHYTDFKNNYLHYQYANAAVTVPSPSSVSAGIDISEYATGHPSPNVSVLDQLKNFPVARYKPGHTLLPNIPLFSPTYLFGYLTYASSYAQAVNNSKVMFPDYVNNFGYSMLVSSNTGEYSNFGDTNTFPGAWIKMANANPSWKTCAFSYWPQLTPKNAGFASQTQYANCGCLSPNHYFRNSSGNYLDNWGSVSSSSRILSPAAPLDSLYKDGLTQKLYLNSLVNKLTRPLDLVFENGEIIPYFYGDGNTLSKDPAVLAEKNASGLDWYSYESKRHADKIKGYRDQFMPTISGLSNTKFVYYYLDGHPQWNLKWNQIRDVNTTINGIRYASGDIYTRWPNNWRYWMAAWKGWQYVVESRHEQLASGDKYFSPAVSPGWDNNEENNVRPAQWLGLLKAYSMLGAEFFYTGYFTTVTPFQDPKGWVWQTVMPSYAQAITSRYEDIFKSGSLLEGDVPNTPTNPQWNAYSFYAGDPRKLVVSRKHNTLARFAITGTIQPMTNMIGATELESVAQIKLDGQNIKFKVRRQGSTYIYDKTDAANPVFYQLDGWHENVYPTAWSKDIKLEAELFDNTNTSIYLRTKRAAGTLAGDFVNATTYVGFNSVSDLVYNFQPRANANANYYVWVKARSKNGQNTVFNVTLDNGTAKQIGCVTDTNWVWYRYNLSDQSAISYLNLATNVNHQLKITPSNTNLEIDLIHLTINPTAIYATPAPCSAIATPTITPSGSTTICQGSNVTLTASSGTSYTWSTGATTQSITVNTTGSYAVTVTSAAGTGTSAPTTVTVNALPTPSISASGATTFCTGGIVTLTASGGNSYMWNPGGQTTSSLAVYSAGNYSVFVYSANGCSAMSSTIPVTVNSNPTSTITAGGATSFCQGGSVALTASAGSSYLWSPGNQTTQTITATNAGSYTVRVTNASGCSTTSAPTSLTVNSLPTSTITASGPTTFAPGGSVVLTASAGSSYLWSPGNQTTQSITVTQAGSYTVRVTNVSGCSAISNAVTVTVTTGTVPTISASGSTTFCTGGSVTLTASAGTSYLWSTGATTQSITASASGSYSVTVTSASGTGTSAPTVVTVNPLPTVTATASGATTFCQGGSVTLTSTAGSSYSWTPGGQTTQAINVTASGTYRVTMTNSNGCANISAPLTVTVNSLPTATITASGPTTFNQGGSVTLTGSAGSSYLWSPGNQTSQAITVTQGGSYSVRVTNSSGCSAISAATVVTVNSTTVPTISASGSTTFCNGGTVTLTASAGTSYLWSTGATTQSIVATTSGSYSVTVTSASGTGTSAPTVVTVNPLPTVTATASGATTFCQGGSVTLTSTAGSSYSWTPGGQTTQAINVTASGTYRVTMTNSNGCANISAPLTVTVNSLPTATITASGPTTFNQGGSVTLTGSAGSSYLWSPGNQTSQAITVTQGGSYSVRVTNSSGCSAISAATVVTVNSTTVPTISASGSTTFCSGGSVTLTASSGTSYLWSTGAITKSIVATAAGSYSVTVTSASGSGTSLPVTVTVNQLPIVTITPSGSTSICQGSNVTLTSTGGVSYLWSPSGQTTKAITVNTAGNYLVKMTNQYGCSATSAITPVVVNANPTSTITASGPTTFNQGGSVVLTAPTNSSYYWYPFGQTTKTITVTQSGNYQVRVTNAAGCSATSGAITVTVIPPANTATITPNGPTTFCSGSSVILTANSGTSYLWSTGATTKSIIVTSSGNYTVTVTSASGSFTSSPTNVTVIALPTATISANGPTTFCAGSNVRLTASYSTTYTYQWFPGGQTTRSINVTSSGTYYVVIKNSTGCTKQSANMVVTVTNCGTCNPPTVMSTTNITSSSAKLNWNIIPVDSFQVRLNNNTTGFQYFSGTLSNAVSSITIGAAASTNYTWWVRSKCGTTFSSYSSANSFTTPALLRAIEDSLDEISYAEFEPMYLSNSNDEVTNLFNSVTTDEFKLIPNPATDISQLIFKTEKSGSVKIILTDLSGRLIKQIEEIYMNGLNVYDLKVDNLPKGMYLVSISTESGTKKTIRLSVQ